MKILSRFLFVILFIAAGIYCNAQTNDVTTIILVRHAEKDTVGKDPQLSAAGKARAEKLPSLFSNLKPDLMYSTPYVRTRQTLMPWAGKAGIEIKDYDPAQPGVLVNELLSLKGKNIIVAGHSNTIPALVNLLIGNAKYQQLDDKDYSKLWVVTIEDGKATEKMVEY